MDNLDDTFSIHFDRTCVLPLSTHLNLHHGQLVLENGPMADPNQAKLTTSLQTHGHHL
jgi:hypothetical protein